MRVEMTVETRVVVSKGQTIEVEEKEGKRLLSLGFAKALETEKKVEKKKKKSED